MNTADTKNETALIDERDVPAGERGHEAAD